MGWIGEWLRGLHKFCSETEVGSGGLFLGYRLKRRRDGR